MLFDPGIASEAFSEGVLCYPLPRELRMSWELDLQAAHQRQQYEVLCLSCCAPYPGRCK